MTIPFEKRTVNYIHHPYGSEKGGKKVSGKTTPETWALWKDRYVVLRNFIPKEIINMRLDAWKTVEQNENWDSAIMYREEKDITHMTPDDAINKSKGGYCTPWAVALHRYIRDRLTDVIDMNLKETYSYTRKYDRGAILTSHTDRPSCEISATLCLDYHTDDGKPWKIWVQNDQDYIDFEDNEKLVEITQGVSPRKRIENGAKCVELEVGDILLYQGPNIPHWRDRLLGDYSYHIFVHFFHQHSKIGMLDDATYVPKDKIGGENIVLEYDGRKNRYETDIDESADRRRKFMDFIKWWDNGLYRDTKGKKGDFCNNYDHLVQFEPKEKK